MAKFIEFLKQGDLIGFQKAVETKLNKCAKYNIEDMKESALFEEPTDVLEGDVLDEDCDTCWIDTELTEEQLQEYRIVYRVTNKGKRLRKIKCGAGKRVANVNGVRKCVAVTGAEKVSKKRAIRKSVRTKRAMGAGFQMKVQRMRKKALKKRKAMGL